jgi:RNA:NAD 2'-phosphotransferase (TPT1/KptA family)
MTEKEVIRTSKFLSLLLRREPEKVGLKLAEGGWVGVDDYLEFNSGTKAEIRIAVRKGILVE